MEVACLGNPGCGIAPLLSIAPPPTIYLYSGTTDNRYTLGIEVPATAIHGTRRSARRAAHAEARLKANAKIAEPAA